MIKIKPFELKDAVLGQRVAFRATPYYYILEIGRKSFYFVKETGDFDGTSFEVKEA